MATSRLERVGTIYSRITGLLRSGALKNENKPVWYDVYQHFPPKFSPRIDRPVPNVEVSPIFYPEDVVRSKLAKEKSSIIGVGNLHDNNRLTNSQKCIKYYEEIRNQGGNEEEALAKAVEKVIVEMPIKRENNVETEQQISITEEFKRAKLSSSIKMTEIFKKD